MYESNKLSEEKETANRLADYKTRSVYCDQERRRFELLSDQKRRREKAFSDVRNRQLFCDSDNENFGEGQEDETDVMEWAETKPKRPRLKEMFMLSEWMTSVPEDFDSKWMFVLCPVGKRCLVHCAKGSTSAYGKRGQRLAKFQSALPSGSQRDVSRCRYSNAEVTILDCIWSSQNKCYFALDLLSWKGQPYMDTEKSFRAFWIKSKLEETSGLSARSERNTYPVIPLEHHPCNFSSISSAISSYAYRSSDDVKIDGLLFYHSEAFYTPGVTPLVLWLKPFMLPEILNVPIPEGCERLKPHSYVDMEHFIKEYEEKKARKKKRLKKSENIDELCSETEDTM